MSKTKKIIISIIIILSLALLILLYLCPNWLKKTEISESSYAYDYSGHCYVVDQNALDWDYQYFAESHKQIGWGIFWSREFFSYQKENPIYIVSPGLGKYLIAFREDFDVWNIPIVLYNGNNISEQHFCLSNLIESDAIVIKPFFDLWYKDNISYVDIQIRMKDYPCLRKTLYVFEYEGNYYVCLDDLSNQYKDTYYLLSDEYLQFFSEFYDIDLNKS